ncbi:MAG: hypothetical protein FJX72_09450 [Armatimonadetes bacterium]|nr:hypothetical protein [Armatimonadota bacterium]
MRKYAVCGAAALALTVAASGAYAAPDGAAIIRKAVQSMRQAKTYQSEWRVIVSMGNMGSMTMNMTMKTTSDGKARVTTEPSGKGTGMMAAGGAMASSTAVSDGKHMYMYMKAMNSYIKAPVTKEMDPALGGQLAALTQKGATYKFVGSEFVRGRKCHVVRVTPRVPQGAGTQGMKMTMDAYVDTQTGRLRQMKQHMDMSGMGGPGPNGGPGAGGRPSEMTTTMVLISEKVNAPLPASTFKFTPPPGAREMKGGPMGGPGMGPGGAPPGAAGRRP